MPKCGSPAQLLPIVALALLGRLDRAESSRTDSTWTWCQRLQAGSPLAAKGCHGEGMRQLVLAKPDSPPLTWRTAIPACPHPARREARGSTRGLSATLGLRLQMACVSRGS